jgi:Repeat of unknown function (DUF346)
MLKLNTIFFCLLSVWSRHTLGETNLAFEQSSISAVSWGPGSLDIFGLDPDGKIWHRYNRGYGWLPRGKYFQNMNSSASLSKPTAVSSQPNRLDFLHVAQNHNVHLRYWLGKDWNPHSGPENLGADFSSAIAAASWAPDRLSIVGRATDRSYWHSFWDGAQWRPINVTGSRNVEHQTWESIGGEFAGPAALVTPRAGRMDFFGTTPEGTIKHKYWSQNGWVPSQLGWEDVKGGPFTGAPIASSWGPGKLDLWSLNREGSLLHASSDDEAPFSDWEDLGGEFSSTPQVVHWRPRNAEIVGRDKQGRYAYKSWDNGRWNPPGRQWDYRGENFVSEPAVVSSGFGVFHVFGIADDGTLKEQKWDGHEWVPSETGWYDLGSTRDPYSAGEELFSEEL